MTEVLPACAGVILFETLLEDDVESFTRMRGGDPQLTEAEIKQDLFYPHARG